MFIKTAIFSVTHPLRTEFIWQQRPYYQKGKYLSVAAVHVVDEQNQPSVASACSRPLVFLWSVVPQLGSQQVNVCSR